MTTIFKYPYFFMLSALIFLPSCENNDKPPTDEVTQSDTTSTLPIKNEVFGVARIEPEQDIVTLDAGATGKILKVLAIENEEIKQGQEILTLDNSIEQAQLTQANSKKVTQEAAEKVAEENLREIQIKLDIANKDLDLAKELLIGKAQTQKAVDDKDAEITQLEQQKVILEANLAQTQAQRKLLDADIRYYQTLLANKKVVAPSDGMILNVMVHAGEYVNASTEILEYAPTGAVIAKTEVDELFAEKIEKGQKAVIYSQMTGEEIARGTVIFASDYLRQKSLFKNQSTELEDRRVREVKVRLEEGDIPLYGSRVDCRIYLK